MLDILRQSYNVGAALDIRFPDESKASPGVAIRNVKLVVTTAIAHNANLDGLGNGLYKLYIPQRSKLLSFVLLGSSVIATPDNSAFSIPAAGWLLLTQTTAPLAQDSILDFLLIESAG